MPTTLQPFDPAAILWLRSSLLAPVSTHRDPGAGSSSGRLKRTVRGAPKQIVQPHPAAKI